MYASTSNVETYNTPPSAFWGGSIGVNSGGGWFSGAKNYYNNRAQEQFATGNNLAGVVDKAGVLAMELLPSSYADVPIMLMAGPEAKIADKVVSRFGQIRSGILKAREISTSRHNVKLTKGLRMDLKGRDSLSEGHYNKAMKEIHGFPHVHDPKAPGGSRMPSAEDYIYIFKNY